MKIFIFIVAIALAALAVAFWQHHARQSVQRTFKTTDEFVQWLADEAVKDADSNQHVKLDYSPGSIKRVDQILGNLHDMYVKEPASISERGLSAAYGAYIGEVIRRSESRCSLGKRSSCPW